MSQTKQGLKDPLPMRTWLRRQQNFVLTTLNLLFIQDSVGFRETQGVMLTHPMVC